MSHRWWSCSPARREGHWTDVYDHRIPARLEDFLEVPALPDLLLDILASGGVLPRLAEQGYLPAAGSGGGA
ncbi:hypothetical protein SAMN04489835_1213 [Mycolicibacterium rutilum]|uniref:Uncharacterized protein n=1 Tax=Mycolicibacterium rutilum TaxID=370526 RepID=A0A1H6J601_MYCRU|nr:hypothetical protein SAMN04489835_1213 [Mycolicibacterium rutilum]